jgi:tryptophan 7-halogenase
MEDGEAGGLLLRTLDQKPLAEPKFLRFQTGRRKLSWNRNVVAIGLSSGFLEPLESTSIHLIHSGLVKLLDFWPDRTFDPLLIEQYNRAMSNQYQSIRDFIILHYKASDREDSEFWKYCKHMAVPDSLSYKLDHFRSSTRIVLSPGELFQPASWFAVMAGQNVVPTGYDSLADLHAPDEVEHRLSSLQRAISHAVSAMPTHRQVLAGLG